MFRAAFRVVTATALIATWFTVCWLLVVVAGCLAYSLAEWLWPGDSKTASFGSMTAGMMMLFAEVLGTVFGVSESARNRDITG